MMKVMPCMSMHVTRSAILHRPVVEMTIWKTGNNPIVSAMLDAVPLRSMVQDS